MLLYLPLSYQTRSTLGHLHLAINKTNSKISRWPPTILDHPLFSLRQTDLHQSGHLDLTANPHQQASLESVQIQESTINEFLRFGTDLLTILSDMEIQIYRLDAAYPL